MVQFQGLFAHNIWFAMWRRIPRIWRATLNKTTAYRNSPASDGDVRQLLPPPKSLDFAERLFVQQSQRVSCELAADISL